MSVGKWGFEGGTYPSSVLLKNNLPLVVICATSHGGGRVIARLLLEAGLGSTKLKRNTLENEEFVHLRDWPPAKKLQERLAALGNPAFLKTGSAMYHIADIERVTKAWYVHVVMDGRDIHFKPWGIIADYNLVMPTLASTPK